MLHKKFLNSMMLSLVAISSVLTFVGCSSETTKPNTDNTIVDTDNAQKGEIAANSQEDIERLIKEVYHDDPSWVGDVLELIGQVAPEFEFTDADGETKHLSDFKGTPIILDIMTTSCPTCVEVHEHIVAYKSSSEIPVISISYDETREMLDASDFPYDTKDIMTTNDDLVELYQMDYAPSLFYIDADGIVRFPLVGSTDLETIQYIASQVFNK